MFGYVKVNSSELKVQEYDFSRGTYCGLCRAMGKCTGQCSRMTLNYDFVFLAIVRMALNTPQVKFKPRRCLAHPLKKRDSMEKNEVLEYCARASAILNYQKIADDLADEKGFKRFRALLAKPFVAHARKKAIKKDESLRDLDAIIKERLAELAKIEQSDSVSVTEPANCFGLILGEIMACGFEGEERLMAFEFGKNIGAWIYMADAIDDMPDDLKKKRYNAFLKLYNGKLPSKEELASISDAIKNHLYGAEAAFDLFPDMDPALKNIIQNILYLGIPNTTEHIIKSHNKKSKRKEASND